MAATYVRPTALPILGIFLALQWIVDRNWHALVSGALIAGLTALVLFSPWSYRSVMLFDRFVLVSANGGVNLWMGNNPASTGGYMDLPTRAFPTEVDRDHYYGREALRFIAAHPLEYAKLSMRRVLTTYDRETIGIVWNGKFLATSLPNSAVALLKRLSSAYWWVMLTVGCTGVIAALRNRIVGRTWPLLAAFGFLAMVPILTVAMDRYHVPLDPLLAIFAAYALCGAKEKPIADSTSE